MTRRRFAWCLGVRGPDLSAWPAGERAEAVALLRGDAAARTLLADALASDDGGDADAAGLRRMQDAVRRALAPATPLVRAVRCGALAACVCAGLYLSLQPAAEAEYAGGVAPTTEATIPATVLAALDP